MFQSADAALIRAAAYPHDLDLPAWPDLTTDRPSQWTAWLRTVWEIPEFFTAVTEAAPDLAIRVTSALNGEPMEARRLRRLVEATARYLLRWTTRPTPFGRFAGIAPIAFGRHAFVRWGENHHDVSRPDERRVAEHTAASEGDLATLRTVQVVTNALGFARGGTWVLPCARRQDGRIWDVEIDLTEPLRVAVNVARSPIGFSSLASVTALKTSTGVKEIEGLLAALVREGVLVSRLRPPMIVTGPAEEPAHHTGLSASSADQMATDRRIDCAVTLPPAVVHEAQEAAAALTAVAPHLPGWDVYHLAFLERWGPGAAVPLREVLAVLGFPHGYRGAPRCSPPPFTEADALLSSLAQQSALDGGTEIVLDQELMERLKAGGDRSPVPHTELRFTLAADSTQDLERGAFTLTVVSGARHAGVAAARFLHLLTEPELKRFRGVYRNLPPAMPGARLVQLSGPPLDVRLSTLARVPELLPVLPVGDFHPDPPQTLDDLAVTGDNRRLWLSSVCTGLPVEPLLLNCVRLPTAQQPLIRFLTEIWTAWNAPCMPFDWGHARGLPFLPRVRRGRSILHSARWIVPATALPARAAPWPEWRDAWHRRRERHWIPREVLIGDDDVRLRLDLEENAHLTLLRSHLDRNPAAVLTEAPGPASWIGGRPAEILLTLTSGPPPRPTTRRARPVTTVQHLPGPSPWLEARFYGPTDHILAHLAEAPELPDGWWFLRYPHPAPHLRVRVPLTGTTFADAALGLAHRAQQLQGDGVLADYTLNTYRPETRYGTGVTLAAAEAVFAEDSRAVLRRLPGDRQATTSAGMIAIAHGFTGDGRRWLSDHAPHHTGARLDPAQLAAARSPHTGSRLAETLAVYRTRADRDGLDADRILADLLHLHHARMIGVDLPSERHCLRLARAIARAELARR
ncbi:lantibiotic dehydratase [Actinocorallia longicatena]|uniref:Lantibiotic dehydratase n=1 Tax=Actinocorallia longicatena TaxID=111803 RepID=A0ABP6Q1T5_9ACTN